MTGRMRAALALGAAVAAVVGGVALQLRAGPRAPGGGAIGGDVTGAWYCPHAGGEGWTSTVTVANPGSDPALVRITSLGPGGAEPGQLLTVPAGSEVTVEVPADRRAAGATVEYFGTWVAAGWTSTGEGEEERGVAAEPCQAEAGGLWFLPDGSTEEGQDAYVVVMNPFDTDSVFSLTLVTEDRRIRPKDWSGYVLPAHQVASFRLSGVALGERTVAGELEVSIGRVVTASVGIAEAGGIRAASGITGDPATAIHMPGGADAGRTAVVAMNPGRAGAAVRVALLGEAAGTGGGVPEEVIPPGSAGTYEVQGGDPVELLLSAEGDEGVAAVRRSSGALGDQGAAPGISVPHEAWVLIGHHAGSSEALPSAVFLANPGAEDVRVTLTPLLPAGAPAAGPIVVVVPAGSMVPAAEPGGLPLGSLLAVADDGTFIPVLVSSALNGSGYAMASGVPVPPRFIP
ncbi:MAG: hypothetical protein HY658_03400 [Actinobacteria bacterium]|nr:hypothetical protein [Actinomycetota bacterium]